MRTNIQCFVHELQVTGQKAMWQCYARRSAIVGGTC